MPILKPIDDTWSCPVTGANLDDVFKNLFGFNGITFVETDTAGSQINPTPYEFFAVNRVLAFTPITGNAANKYNSMRYECVLTIARAVDARLEVETISVDGQFDTITREFLGLDFVNTLKSYFTCCDIPVEIVRCVPIWNSNRAATAVNHTGVEVYLNVTI